ncbi:MAG: recombinase A [Deltaproteobacteria bacterium]|nr:recombinase A [Deltaproteobacteria bacterium]
MKRLLALGAGPDRGTSTARWSLSALLGRLVEICAAGNGAPLTQAMGLVLEAQAAGELVAWVTPVESSFFPPDATASGVDLAALVVIRAPDLPTAARAADKLLRSGGLGLVVLDAAGTCALPTPLLARLASLARAHHSALVVLTRNPAERSPLGSLVALRLASSRRCDGDRFICALAATKDRQAAPGWSHSERCLPPPGLY